MSVKVTDLIDLAGGFQNSLLVPQGIVVRSLTLVAVTASPAATLNVRVGGGSSFPMRHGWVLTGLTGDDSIAGIYGSADPQAGTVLLVIGSNDV